MQTESKLPTEGDPAERAQPVDETHAPAWHAGARGVAMFFGSFSLLNLFGELRHSGFDANIWWIDLRPCPAPIARGLLAFAALLLISFAVRPHMHVLRRGTTILMGTLLFVASVWNVFVFYALLGQGHLRSDFALPFSLHVAACFAVILAGLMPNAWVVTRPRRDLLIGLVTFQSFIEKSDIVLGKSEFIFSK